MAIRATRAVLGRRILPPGPDRLLFGVMLMTAIGTTGMMSVMPAIGRSLHLPDQMIAVAFSFSALAYALVAPLWARRLGRLGAKRMVLIGITGFVASMLVAGVALTLGLTGAVPPIAAFIGFICGRALYGLFGAASPPAAQAMLVASVPREARTKALSLLASAFGLGTIVGPALAPFFVLPGAGLAGPAYFFALGGMAMGAVVVAKLPDLQLPAGTRLPVQPEPTIGAEPDDTMAEADLDADDGGELRFSDRRTLPWITFGLVSGHAQAIAGQTLAFLLIDRLAQPPLMVQPLIGGVLMAGALASLLAQWGVIPRLDLQPRAMLLSGAALAAAGCLIVALSSGLHGITVGFAIASLGFGFLRPGFTAGASLAVGEHEQGAVAGQVTAVNGCTFVLGPSMGIFMYGHWHPLPYLACAAAMMLLIPYGLLRLRGS